VYCELRYQGQLYDAETGLCYNRHRYYDAESGQYLSPDPIGLLGGIRPRGYVHNLLEWVDPLGLTEKDGKEIPERGYHNETYAPKPVKPEDAVDKWDGFLGPGPGPHTNIHPRTDEPDPDRIVSADGKRCIRYGNHEMGSKPTKHHYHEETWTHDTENNVMNVDNLVIRVPFKK
ncbi:RHS repeat-associated core domain-containing protein, partial [Pectobacterium parmentieri]|uniref:RHS repeat-associated core domain-containing protein n=1 Tax=Pectobacterium parmentieri TaxID=1905730 RepID=UPI0022B75E81